MIRPVRPEDLDACMEIWLEGNLQAHSFIPAAYWHEAYAAVRDMLPQATLWVEEEAGTVRGFIGLQNGYVAGLFIAAPFRSCGIGGRLLAFCQKTCDTLSLEVYQKNNRALHFYQRHGFHLIQERMDACTGESAYYMTWDTEEDTKDV